MDVDARIGVLDFNRQRGVIKMTPLLSMTIHQRARLSSFFFGSFNVVHDPILPSLWNVRVGNDHPSSHKQRGGSRWCKCFRHSWIWMSRATQHACITWSRRSTSSHNLRGAYNCVATHNKEIQAGCVLYCSSIQIYLAWSSGAKFCMQYLGTLCICTRRTRLVSDPSSSHTGSAPTLALFLTCFYKNHY